DFRGVRFEAWRDGGRFRHARAYRDPLGRAVVETMDNDGTHRVVNGESVALDDAERAQVETAVHSVVYFAFLPFRLEDPAVRLRELPPEELAGVPYRRIEVTFAEEG